MNAEMYIPVYGNYMTIKQMLSEEESDRPFLERAVEAIAAGAVSGMSFGVTTNIMPGKASISLMQTTARVLTAAPAAAPLALPVALAAANFAVIESAPEEEQRGLWQMYSSALTGTFGGGFSGLV